MKPAGKLLRLRSETSRMGGGAADGFEVRRDEVASRAKMGTSSAIEVK